MATGVVAVVAVTSEGYSAARVDLNDSGVWVTRPGQLGRLNTEVLMLDGGLAPEAHEVDVVQDSGMVFRRTDDGVVARVDPANLAATARIELPKQFGFDQRAGSAVVWNPDDGKAWVRPATAILSLDLEAEMDRPDVTAGPGASAVVGTDGVVHVLSVERDEVVSVAVGDTGASGQTIRPLGVDVVEGSISAVGVTPVVLDGKDARLVVPGAVVTPFGEQGGRLQQAGPAAADALVAVDGRLLAVPLTGGSAATLADSDGADPVTPARVGECAYAAWNTTPSYVIACNGQVVESKPVTEVGNSANLRLRVNRGRVALNDVRGGLLWVLDRQLKKAKDNWEDAEPAKQKDDPSSKTDPGTTQAAQAADRSARNRPPQAEPDQFGARPGRSTILRVLDNDRDPDGDVLVIARTDGFPASSGRLEAIENGQALQFTPDPGVAGDQVRFSYTVDDGRGQSARAAVTVDVRAADDPGRPPAPIPGRTSATVVEAGRSVTYNVLGDWRDPDGDPLQLVAAASADPKDTVRWSPEGAVTLTASAQVGKRSVSVTVSDGVKEATGRLVVTVRPPGQLDPRARPDFYVGTVGQQLVLRPLANDNDPNGDEIRLTKVAKRNEAGVTVQEDVRTGVIRFRADKAGSFSFLYYISGGTKPVAGVVRVDVRAKAENVPPVAVLDVGALSPDLTTSLDVLANDYDPDGDVLVVTGVSAPAGVAVAVQDHRVLAVRASRVPDKDVALRYTVSDGYSQPVQGTVVIRRPVFGSGRNQPPVANPDEAVVRAGDVVTVRVLANDSDPDADPLTLKPTVSGLGSGDGLAFVTGSTVRFQAPAEPRTVKVVYSVTDGKDSTSSRVTIRVRPADPSANQPPQPQPIEARVVSANGEAVVIPVPLDGIDPDGDSVRLVGTDQPAPALASSVTWRPDGSLLYTPRRNASGTDTFGYKVSDAFGLQATGLVRVGVAAPAENQDPTPVDDLVIATPGKPVTVDVLANDSDPDGQKPRLCSATGTRKPLEPQPGVQAKVVGSRVQVTAPADGRSAGVVYCVEDGSGGYASATLTVTGSATVTNLPPTARDDFPPLPKRGEESVSVAVLDNDDDADGAKENLRVTRVLPETGTEASVRGGNAVVATLRDRPRVVAYEVTDGQDTAVAFVYVPAKVTNSPPALRAGAKLEVQAGSPPATVELATYVEDPDGDTVKLGAADKVSGDRLGQAEEASPTAITYTPVAKGSGTGVISFEVIDGPTLQDAPHTVFLSLPVVVSPAANTPPTVRDGALSVAQGEEARTIDVKGLVVDDADDTVTLGAVQSSGTGIDARADGTVISVTASADAPKGSTGTVTFTVSDRDGATANGRLRVTVTGSTRPLARLADKSVPEAKAGSAVTVSVAEQTSYNPFPDSPLRVLSASRASGEATVSHDEGSVTVIPAAGFHGQATVTYRVEDRTRDADRAVEGRILLTVRDKPDRPNAPVKVSSGDSTVTLSWVAPAANGSAITDYVVAWSGGSQRCGPVTECAVTGLRNGTAYAFTVQAVNGVGPGDTSEASERITPDVVPASAPTPTVVRPDTQSGGVLVVSWGAFANKGSPIRECLLSNGSTEVSVGCDSGNGKGSYTWSGLENGQSYRFTVRATNQAGTSDPSDASDPADGVPAGRPSAPGAPRGSDTGSAAGKQIKVTWPAADGNGVAVSTYTLTIRRSGSVEKTQTFPGGTLSATVDVAANGSEYTFTVRAKNAVGESAESPASAPVVPFGAPGVVTGVSATPGDRQVTLAFTDPADNGQAITKREAKLGDGSVVPLGAGKVVTGLANGTSYTFAVRACNAKCGPWSALSAAVIPFGPPGVPSVNAAVASPTMVNLSWSAPSPNGRAIAKVQISVNGGAWQDQGLSGTVGVDVGHGGTGSIVARAVDAEGQIGAGSAAASAATPPTAVDVWKGPAYTGGGNFIMIRIRNGRPNSVYGCLIHPPSGNVIGFDNWQRNVRTDANGNGSNEGMTFDPANRNTGIRAYAGSGRMWVECEQPNNGYADW